MFKIRDDDVTKEVMDSLGVYASSPSRKIEHFAVLEGYANTRLGNILKEHKAKIINKQTVIQEGDCSIVCMMAQHNSLKIPVGINRAGKLEICVRLSGGKMFWDEKLQDEIASKCEDAMLENSILGKVGI